MTLMPERILARIAMRPRSDALYLIWFCWGLALLLYVAGSAYYKLPIVPLLLMVLLLMVEKTKMFGRKRNESEMVGAGSTTTVIAKGPVSRASCRWRAIWMCMASSSGRCN